MPSCRSFLQKLAVLVPGIVALAILIGPIRGQTFYGSIVGTVTDSSGAAVQNAAVTLTNTGTDERRTAKTGADGIYRFVNLVPGNYKVDIEAPGFRHYTRDSIPVNVEAAVRNDVTMQLGDVTQSVEVSAAAPLLQTENASLSQVVNGAEIQGLPLNGRNVLNLVELVPGVVPQGLADGSPTGKNVFAAGNYQIGGGTANQSASFFDGAPMNITYGNIIALNPTQDAVEEFRVQTNNNTAEYGRYTGGVINLTSKSGTNDFHGSVYEFLRNKALNATSFFANSSGSGKAAFVQNQFGGNFGGPIKKNKMFFFGSYEGYRARAGVLFTETVPTPAELKGDFSGYLSASGTQVPIYNPFSTTCPNPSNLSTCTRTAFPGNIIPASLLNPVSTNIIGFPEYALPNTAGQQYTNNFNFASNVATGGNNDQVNGRFDDSVSDKQRILARFTRLDSKNQPVNVYGNGFLNGDPYSPEFYVTTQAVLADTYVISPTKVLDVRGSFTRWYYTRIPGTLGTNESTALGFPSYMAQIPSLNGEYPSTTRPGITISSPTTNAIGTGLLLGRDDTYALTPTFTWIKGKHTLKFGAEVHKNELNYFQNNSPGGTFSFDNAFTSVNSLSPGATGSGLASFELGLPTGASYASLVQTSFFTFATLYYQGYFVTDTFQASNKLTLTMGMRWEIPGVYTERFNRQATFNPTEPNPALQGILVNGAPVLGAFDLTGTANHPESGLSQEHYGLVAPRLGVAYRMSDKTVIRTGGGIFFIPATIQFTQGPYSNPVDYYNNVMITSLNGGVTPQNTLSNPFPNGLLAPPGRNPIYQVEELGGSLGGHGDLAYENAGYTMQWNFTVQHQFPTNIALEVGYAGLRGKHLPLGYQFDQLSPQYFSMGSALNNLVPNPFAGVVATGALAQPTVKEGQLLLPYPQYLSVSDPGNYDGDSTYHSLQAKVEKRFHNGGTLLAAYTFSKVLADVESLTTWLDTTLGGDAGYQNYYNLRGEKSLSSFDVRQRLVISYTYNLPLGKGQALLPNVHGIADKLVSGWGLNGATTFQLGLPLGFTATPNNLSAFNVGLRPNVVAGCDKTVSGSATSRLNDWFNTACFTVPTPYTLGDESRTDPNLRGPGINNFDFALFKQIAITERFNLEFRTEAFNLFNRVQFAPPNLVDTTAANSTFGVISAQLNQPRLIQLALRLRF
jgi:Carboxypeptidase regulatory-like domain